MDRRDFLLTSTLGRGSGGRLEQPAAAQPQSQRSPE